MSNHSNTALLLKIAGKTLANAGIAMDEVMAESRAPWPEHAALATQRIFWQALEQSTGNPHIGLHLVPHVPSLRGHVLEQFFYSSASFGEGLQRALGFQRLLSDVTALRLVVNGQHCYLADISDSSDTRHFVELGLARLLSFFSSLTEGRFRPLRIHFRHAQGAPAELYDQVYGCPVTLGCGEARVYFQPEVLDWQVWQADPEQWPLHKAMACAKLRQLRHHDLLADVHQVIATALAEGEDVSQALVARRLGLSVRRLRVLLAEADVTFLDILVQYRAGLARQLLEVSAMDIPAIADRTGFGDVSAFYRAFKRWTGATPTLYRQQHQRPPAGALPL